MKSSLLFLKSYYIRTRAFLFLLWLAIVYPKVQETDFDWYWAQPWLGEKPKSWR